MLGLGRGCFRLVLSETTFRIPLRSLPVGGRNLRERERERYYVATTLRDASESVRSEPISTMLILLLDPGDFDARGFLLNFKGRHVSRFPTQRPPRPRPTRGVVRSSASRPVGQPSGSSRLGRDGHRHHRH